MPFLKAALIKKKFEFKWNRIKKIHKPMEGEQFLIPFFQDNGKKQSHIDLSSGYWDSVVDNARRVATIGTEQEKAAALMMLRMAEEAITGTEGKTTPATTSINAYNGDHSSYNGNILSTGHEN